MVGTTVALVVGGVIVAPFASASDRTGAQWGNSRRGGAVERWVNFWRDRRGDRGGNGIGGGNNGGGNQGIGGGGGGGRFGGGGGFPGFGGGGGGGFPGFGGGGGGSGTSANPSGCADVELVFARGTGDFPQPLGILGVPLGAALKQALPGRNVRATGVDYAADFAQASDGPGATEMTRYVTAVAGRCANTTFVIGGYSQGASLTDIAVAARGAQVLGRGDSIPETLAPRIAAVVVFGNPLSGFGSGTLENASTLYRDKTKSFCGNADTICGGARNGNVQGGHLSYNTNGAVNEAARFAAGKIGR